MKSLSLAFICLALPAAAQVSVTRSADRITVEIDGKPFTQMFIGPDAAKPYLFPLRAASGTLVTRGFPLDELPGDSKDHPHHRGLNFAHADVNGSNFWANEAFNPGAKGKIVLDKVERLQSGRKKGSLQASFKWLDAKGTAILSDRRTITFYSQPALRTFDYDIVLTALETARFGDTHEGSFGVRVASWLEEPAPKYVPKASKEDVRPTEPKRTGRILNSEGLETEAQVRGKRANWADYSGEYKGEKLGIAILDHPSNPRHPTYWHTRGYGMFAANIFAVSDLGNEKAKDGSMTLKPGEQLKFRYRVVIHPGTPESAGIAKLYSDYSK
ncbi:MAG TPA: PmoA family protein [Bryobacteraceae bacterium]|nr:PmoA family protein [Bryobacteraceae bacterium]